MMRASWFLVVLVAVMSSAAVSMAQDPGFRAAKDSFLRAVSSGDSDQILDDLPNLAQYDEPDVARLLMKHCLLHSDLLVHQEAMGVLSRQKNKKAQDLVMEEARKSKEWERRATCCRIIASYSRELAYVRLEEALEDPKWQVRSSAIRALGFKRRNSTIPLLIGRLRVEPGRLKADVGWALRQLTGETYEAEYADWNNWWSRYAGKYEMPTLAEVQAKLKGGERKKLGTAVREGLYGPIYSEKIAFLLDASGSMTVGAGDEKTRIRIAQAELSRVIENQLTPSSYFNVIAFDDKVWPFKKKLQKASESTSKKALKYIQKLTAGGETNAYDALELAFADPDVDTIFLLSDGSPTVGKETIPDIIRLKVAEWNRNRRVVINCIGFFPGEAKHQDKDEARRFLRELAHENEGFYREIY